jgi:hypothetical protein
MLHLTDQKIRILVKYLYYEVQIPIVDLIGVMCVMIICDDENEMMKPIDGD